jgi:hypothetical protein
MTTATTLKIQVRKINAQSRGQWTRFMGDYVGQVFDGDVTADAPSFCVYVSKEDGRWVVSTEEHEPDEMVKQGAPANGFRTLGEAKDWLDNEWSPEFQECWIENQFHTL